VTDCRWVPVPELSHIVRLSIVMLGRWPSIRAKLHQG
jgi:hypothetical protein